MSAFDAARRWAIERGLPADDMAVLKDGSNLVVHLRPAPVVLRIATVTAQVRSDPLPYLQREVALVSYLASVGAAVIPPSELVEPGPYLAEGWALTAWAYVEHEIGAVPSAADAFAVLDDLHAAMRGFTGRLPLLNPVVDDLDRAIALCVAKGLVSADEARDQQARRDELLARLLSLAPDRQALHGDAFARNALVTPAGPVWIDFEDCCVGPVLWDLATLVRRDRDPAIVAEVERRHGAEALAVAIALRSVQAEPWTAIHEARLAGGLPPEAGST